MNNKLPDQFKKHSQKPGRPKGKTKSPPAKQTVPKHDPPLLLTTISDDQAKSYPKYVTKDNPMRIQRDHNIIIDAKINGLTYTQLQAKYGVWEQVIHSALKDEDYRDIIQACQQREVLGLTRASEQLDTLVESEDEYVRLKAIERRQKNTGIAPSPTTNLYINSLMLDARTQVLNPNVLAIIGKSMDDIVGSGENVVTNNDNADINEDK